MSKHTPGDWKATRVASGPRYIEATGNARIEARVIAEVYPRWTTSETQANVDLILSASKTAAKRDRLKAVNAELLAALVGLMGDGSMDEFEEDFSVIVKARNAIAIAKEEKENQ